jgi:putative serine protease PepD
MNDTDLFWPAPSEQGDAVTEPLPTAAGPPGRPRQPWKLAAASAALASVVFGGVGVGVGAALTDGSDTTTGNAGFSNGSPTAAELSTNPKSYTAIAARVLPSVVSINVTGQSGQDTGSGVVLRADGYVLTNNHVVSAATNGGNISVVFNDGSTASARIVGTDQEDDLAVIKVDRTGLTPAVLGRSSAVRVGDAVLAIGSPLGLTGTVTAGIVSALNRPVNTTQDQQVDPFGNSLPTTVTVINAIQTDAAVNPGNSGGPLVDALGQVIGINSAIASTGSALGQAGNIGVGFAIPIDQAKVVAQELIQTGHVSHPLMGVSLADATDNNGNPLARVQALTPNGPAARAGIKVGDVVVSVGGQKTAGADAVIAAIRSHQPGERVSVVVERDGSRKTFTVTLADASTQG